MLPPRDRAPRFALEREVYHRQRHGHPILVLEDDLTSRRLLIQTLERHGYHAVEGDFCTPPDDLVAQLSPMVLLLGLDTDVDHLSSLARLRERSAIPVIALSARNDEGDQIAALDAGADDYVTKPFRTGELLARIRVAMRHARGRRDSDDVLQAGPIQIDHARYQVTVQGKRVHLTPTEHRLLTALARQPGKVLSRDQLLHEVWGPGIDTAHPLRVHIAALRHKIEKDPARPRWLVTVTGIGYRLHAA